MKPGEFLSLFGLHVVGVVGVGKFSLAHLGRVAPQRFHRDRRDLGIALGERRRLLNAMSSASYPRANRQNQAIAATPHASHSASRPHARPSWSGSSVGRFQEKSRASLGRRGKSAMPE